MSKDKSIWIFHGSGARFASAVFDNLKDAERYISIYKLTGLLTKYPVNKSCLDWAMENTLYEEPKENITPQKIEMFTSAYQEHYHFEDGIRG